MPLLDFDEVVTKELFFDNMRVPKKYEGRFRATAIQVIGALRAGESIREVRRLIKNSNIERELKHDLEVIFVKQYGVIAGKIESFKLNQLSIAGLTFTESVVDKEESSRRRLLAFMVGAQRLLAANGSLKDYVRDETRRYRQSNEMFWKTQTKSAREYAYQEADKSFDNIKGWVSIAILDRRTSPICLGLHNRFYSRQEYSSRGQIPDLPPRHPFCRSIVITVNADVSVREVREQSINSFFNRNLGVAKSILGEEKYRLWRNGTAKFDKYIDVKGRRLFSIDEIVKRLGIKSR